MGIFGGTMKPLLSRELMQGQQQPMLSRELMAQQQDRMPSMGYDRNAAMMGQSGFAPMNAGFTEQKKPGFFGKGGAFVNILGAFGDAFSENGPVYAQQKAQRNRLMQMLLMAEQKRQQEREDFIWKSQYERDNPKPINNDTVNDLNWYKGLSEEDRKLYHQMKPVTGLRADGTPYAYNPYELNKPRGPVTPPPEAISELKNNPGAAAQFDEIFGQGAAARVLGGPVQQAPVTFSGQ